MTVDLDTILEHRRLRRRVTFWRVLAVVIAVVAVAAVVMLGRDLGALTGARQIARIEIHGLITLDRRQLELLERVAKSDRVAAVLLDVNSPGGTTAGGEALFEAIRDVAEKKPVVAQFGTIATSAAYIVGLASDHIVSRGNTVTGSIGVIFQWAEVHQLLDKIGVTMREVKSGDLKAAPSMFEPVDEEGRQLAEEMVAESYDWFLELVRERRGVDPQSVEGLTTGRIYSGRQAHDLKLVDGIGGEDAAVEWLVEEKGVPAGLSVEEWKVEDRSAFGLGYAGEALAALIGPVAAERLIQLLAGGGPWERPYLDGLVSVWQSGRN